jgi:hypothetical protein
MCHKNFDVHRSNTRENSATKSMYNLENLKVYDIDAIPFCPMQISVPWFWVLLFS